MEFEETRSKPPGTRQERTSEDVKPQIEQTKTQAQSSKQSLATGARTKPLETIQNNKHDEVKRKIEETKAENIKQSLAASAINKLLDACREGKEEDVKRLIGETNAGNTKQPFPLGDSPLHVAAASGHMNIVKYLVSQKFPWDLRNDNEDTPWHLAAKHGHWQVLKWFMCDKVDVKAKNKKMETILHCVAQYDHDGIIEQLVQEGVDINAQDSLVQEGFDINAQDSRGWTPLHVACCHGKAGTVTMLLQLGCQPDVEDNAEETPLHIACRRDLIDIVKILCKYDSGIDYENQSGMTPLLIAARFASIDLVRYLLLAGADIGACSKEGVNSAEVALANGRKDMSDLLKKLTSTLTRDPRGVCVKQLKPLTSMISCIRVNLFGNSGVGKTALIASLKCGLVQSLFHHGSSLLSAVTGSGRGSKVAPPKRTINGSKASADSNGGIKDKVASVNELKRTLLCPAPSNAFYTRGITVENTFMSDAGEVTFWDFSGYEGYYTAFDANIIGDSNAINIIVASRLDSEVERRRQIVFWLNFIRSRVPPDDFIGFGGRNLWGPRILIVFTHADQETEKPAAEVGGKSNNNINTKTKLKSLAAELYKEFEAELMIKPRIFMVDNTNPTSAEMKLLRQTIGKLKDHICKNLPHEAGLLQPVINVLPDWCDLLGDFPVVTFTSFTEFIRSRINQLATEDHVYELLNQLSVTGEIVCFSSHGEELIVLDPDWLTSDVIGHLFAHENVTCVQNTGLLRINDLKALFRKTKVRT